MGELGVWFDATLQGLHHPGFILLTLILTTFLFEDVAVAGGVAVATSGVVTWPESIAAVAFGIALGDLGLYGLGVALRNWQWLNQRLSKQKRFGLEHYTLSKLPTTIFLARAIPGMRLFAYTYCGYIKVSIWRFTAWVCVAVVLWTFMLYALSFSLGAQIAQLFHVPKSIAVMLPMIVFALLLHRIGKWRQSKVSSQASVPIS
jgi:membrane protein DedA with SNARE-associated domain